MLTDGRINPLGEHTETFERSLEALANLFDTEWLDDKTGANPLQKVWGRRDALASSELINLGNDVVKLGNPPNRWLNDIVTKIKSDDALNRQGAIFELFIAGALEKRPTQRVQFPLPNNPGFDLALAYWDGARMRISLKNYGHSVHFQTVVKECRVLEHFVQTNATTPVQIIVMKAGDYPSPSEWRTLHEEIQARIRNGRFGVMQRKDWSVDVSPLLTSSETLADDKVSYKVLVSIPYHRNEQKNLLSKLDDACANMVKHGLRNQKT